MDGLTITFIIVGAVVVAAIALFLKSKRKINNDNDDIYPIF